MRASLQYRPSNLDELVSQADIVSTSALHGCCARCCACFCNPPPLLSAVTRLIDANRLPHILFYGPPGTGKTTTILAIARKLYGANFQAMVLEVRRVRGACACGCGACVRESRRVAPTDPPTPHTRPPRLRS